MYPLRQFSYFCVTTHAQAISFNFVYWQPTWAFVISFHSFAYFILLKFSRYSYVLNIHQLPPLFRVYFSSRVLVTFSRIQFSTWNSIRIFNLSENIFPDSCFYSCNFVIVIEIHPLQANRIKIFAPKISLPAVIEWVAFYGNNWVGQESAALFPFSLDSRMKMNKPHQTFVFIWNLHKANHISRRECSHTT